VGCISKLVEPVRGYVPDREQKHCSEPPALRIPTVSVDASPPELNVELGHHGLEKFAPT
jgi:hypothetical protein